MATYPFVVLIGVHGCEYHTIANDDSECFFVLDHADVLLRDAGRPHPPIAVLAEVQATGMARRGDFIRVGQQGVDGRIDPALLVALIGGVIGEFEIGVHDIRSSKFHDLRWDKKICLRWFFSKRRPLRTSMAKP